jgi:hypothetical protein
LRSSGGHAEPSSGERRPAFRRNAGRRERQRNPSPVPTASGRRVSRSGGSRLQKALNHAGEQPGAPDRRASPTPCPPHPHQLAHISHNLAARGA